MKFRRSIFPRRITAADIRGAAAAAAYTCAVAVTLAAAHAQTTIDLRTQAKSVDFGGASYTRPTKTGTVVPANCTVGELFFLTTAAPGRNLYLCSLPNYWVVITPVIDLPSVSDNANKVLSNDGSAPGWRSIGGDLRGPLESLRVTGLQGMAVGSASPAGNQALRWNAATQEWLPGEDPIATVFGRKGAVTAQSGDYSFAQLGGTAAIWQGGTGGSSAAEALTNLGAAAASHRHNWSDLNGATSQHGSASLVQMFGGGAVNANDCARFDESGNLVSSGAPCGTSSSSLPAATGQQNVLLGTDGSTPNWRTIGSGLMLSNTSLSMDGSVVGMLGGTNTWTQQNAFQGGHIVSGPASYVDHSGAGWTAPFRGVTSLPGSCQADVEWVSNTADGSLNRCNSSGTGWSPVSGASGQAAWGSITSGSGLSAQTDLWSALQEKEASANKGIANGYAPLDSGAKVSWTYLPSHGSCTGTDKVAGFDANGQVICGADVGGGTGGSGDVSGPNGATSGNLASFGSSTGKVIVDSGKKASDFVAATDARLSDARTPTAHKSTHAAGGADALAPSDIGAPRKFSGTAAPGSIAGNLPGDLYTDTTNHHQYVCGAASGAAAPACTSVAAGQWQQIDGGGGSGAVTAVRDNLSLSNGTEDFYPLDTRTYFAVDEFDTYGASCTSSVGRLRWLVSVSNGTASCLDNTGAMPAMGIARCTLNSTATTNTCGMSMGSSSYRPWGEIGNTAIPWEMKFIFRIGQTANIKMRIGVQQQMSYQVQPANGIALRFDTSAGDTTTFTWEIRASNATTVIPGPPVDTNWHTIKLRGTGTAGKIALSVDGGAESTVCPSGGGCTANANAITTGLGPYWYVGADTAAAANTIDVDYFGFWARVSTNASGERF